MSGHSRRGSGSGLREVKFEKVRGWKPGFYNPTTLIKVGRGIVLETGSGSRDDISVFKQGDNYYVLSVSRSLPYVGAVSFYTGERDNSSGSKYDDYDNEGKTFQAKTPSGDVFLQGSEQVEESLGEDWDDLSDREMVERLMDYL